MEIRPRAAVWRFGVVCILAWIGRIDEQSTIERFKKEINCESRARPLNLKGRGGSTFGSEVQYKGQGPGVRGHKIQGQGCRYIQGAGVR